MHSNAQLLANCKQLKLPARDGKRYKTDVIDETMLNALIAVIRSNKKDYMLAMEKSVLDETPILQLIQNALTDQIDDREVFMKGIDYSYYYESEE